MSIPVHVGEFLPLFVVIDTGEEDLDVSAQVFVRSPFDIIEDDISLIDIGNGKYQRTSNVLMPDVDFVDVIYTVLDSSGNLLRKGSEVFVNAAIYNEGGGGASPSGDVIATIINNDSFTGIVQLCS